VIRLRRCCPIVSLDDLNQALTISWLGYCTARDQDGFGAATLLLERPPVVEPIRAVAKRAQHRHQTSFLDHPHSRSCIVRQPQSRGSFARHDDPRRSWPYLWIQPNIMRLRTVMLDRGTVDGVRVPTMSLFTVGYLSTSIEPKLAPHRRLRPLSSPIL
jgi:hypothetical protein